MPLRSFTVDGPLDLRSTLGALGMRLERRLPASADDGWHIALTPGGPGTVHLRRVGPMVEAEAWGPGASWLLDAAPALVGADDDPDGFAPVAPVLRRLHGHDRGLRLGRTGWVMGVLVPVVLAQKVTTEAARKSYRRIVDTWGTAAPGPLDARLAPSPEVLASLRYEDLHRAGVERRRALLVIEVARRARRMEEALHMGRDAAYERLTAVPGIGPWTAGHVMGIAWGDRDAVPVGDFHLPNTVAWALAGEPRADDARMLELLEPYRGQRRRVVQLLKRNVHAPSFGPRNAVREFSSQ
jgi:3-methyladenine DNA glycosylase/8-oxoguanine DNA glycosylase